MAEIVPLFGPRPKPAAKPESSDPTQQPADEGKFDIDAAIAKLEALGERGKPLAAFFRMRKYLDSLVDSHIPHKVLEQRRLVVGAMTEDELRAVAVNSGPADWQVHPSYFWAVIDELEERIKSRPLRAE